MKKKLLFVLIFSSLVLASCGNESILSSVASFSSDVSSANSVSSAVPFESDLPDYEKADYSSSYVGDDNIRNFYHIFVYSFADSNGDGVGDLQGITDKMDYLRKKGDPHAKGSLGINGIFLSPIYPSPSYHKYDITDYKNVDPQFGSLSSFDNLIKAAHERGIKVILDMVLNHSSNKSDLYTKAISALYNTDEYDPATGYPTAAFISAHPEVGYFRFIHEGFKFQTYSNRLYKTVKNWYFEGFADSMPDWNLDNQAVRDMQKEFMYFWLDRGVDGFRLDAVQSFYGEASINLDMNYEYLNYVNKEVKDKKADAYIVAEGPWSMSGAGPYMKNTDIDSYFNFDTDEANIAYSYSTYLNRLRRGSLNTDGLSSFYSQSGRESALNPNHIDAYFNSNHDVGRMTNQFIVSGQLYLKEMKFHYGFQNLFKGNYFLYYGDEMGLTGVKDGNDDKWCRSPFRWGDSYTPTDLEYGLSDVSKAHFETVDKQIEDGTSLFNYFRHITKVKDYNPEIARGESQIVKQDDTNKIFTIKKTYKDSSLYCLINFGTEKRDISLTKTGASGQIRNCLSTDNTYAALSDGTISLPPLSITIVK
jgi:alpha-amylase